MSNLGSIDWRISCAPIDLENITAEEEAFAMKGKSRYCQPGTEINSPTAET